MRNIELEEEVDINIVYASVIDVIDRLIESGLLEKV